LALRLNLARLKRIRGTPDEDQLIDEIEQTAGQIDREIRSFAFLHYPAEIEREGLSQALRYLTRGFAARTGLKIGFDSLGDATASDGPAGVALLRVAQEALMNVHRHARAVHVRVTLAAHDGLLELTVRDDGIGLPADHDATKSHGVGLPGMRHRVERLGGRFAMKRMKHGTRLTASVPLA
jgi:signal transduction histidine kinase